MGQVTKIAGEASQLSAGSHRLRVRRAARTVTDTQYPHHTTDHFITDDIWRDAQQFTSVRAWHLAPPMGEQFQTLARCEEANKEVLGRPGIELLGSGSNCPQLGQGGLRPDDLVQEDGGLGQGSSSGFPHDLIHFMTASCRTNRPEAISARAASSAASSAASLEGVSKLGAGLTSDMITCQSCAAEHRFGPRRSRTSGSVPNQGGQGSL
jgi:hypothetical protein